MQLITLVDHEDLHHTHNIETDELRKTCPLTNKYNSVWGLGLQDYEFS